MKTTKSSPPRLFLRFFRWFCHPDLHPYIEGDLLELYEDRVKKSGKRRANPRFMMDVVLLFRPGMIKPGLFHPVHALNPINQYTMFRNYGKVGFRNILKYKVFSFINVFGLALAMSVCMLIILMLADQKSYDQFNEKKDRIYRILSDDKNSPFSYATSPVPLAGTLKADYPIIEESTHLIRGVGGDATYKEKVVELRGFFSDPSFFTVFSFGLERGDQRSALAAPNSMVITHAYARQLFGDEDPIGKIVEFVDRGLHYLGDNRNEPPPTPWGIFTITGVFSDHHYKSHLKFDVLVSSSTMQALYQEKKINNLSDNWQNFYECFTYVLLIPEANHQDLSASLNNLVQHTYANFENLKNFTLTEQKLTEITPGIIVGNPTSYSMPMIAYYFLLFLALLIILSACLNYTNLSIARALTRAKEIGVRKVMGANRIALLFQFLIESMITVFFSLTLAVILLLFIKPAFRELWINQYLNFDLNANISIYLVFIGFALLLGIFAGFYPALYLSRYQPAKVLKNIEGVRAGRWGMRKVVSVSQFVISLLFVTTSILIFHQFKHFLGFEYGFTSKNIVNVALQGNNYQKIASELSSVPGISTISVCDIIPATGLSNSLGVRPVNSDQEYQWLGTLRTDENFVDNLELKLIAGRNLPASGKTSDRYILVNEAAVKELGYQFPAEIIGQVFEASDNKEAVEVIGVVKDFRFKMLIEQDEIGPLVLRNQPDFVYANVKIASNDLRGTIAKLEAKWKSIDPVHPFKYEFYDEQLAATHQGIGDLVSILGFIAFLAIVIACLGMLGMVTHSSERKTKEVGIRKVLGAENYSIAWLLSKEFLTILAISILIAAPLSYFFNNFWLQFIPNRVDFGWSTLLIGSIILLVLGLVTIGSQTIRAARRNPVETIRME